MFFIQVNNKKIINKLMIDKNLTKPFQKCKMYFTSSQGDYILNKIKGEIFSKLPFLDEKERYRQEKIQTLLKNPLAQFPQSPNFNLSPSVSQVTSIKTTTSDAKKELANFYTELRKKYSNFLELQYLSDDLLSNLYNYLYSWESQKKIMMNYDFKLIDWVYTSIENTSPEVLPDLIKKSFKDIGSNVFEEEDNSNYFWLHANMEPKKDNAVINILKYYKELDDAESIAIIIDTDYYNLIQDIYSLLICRKNIKKIVLQINKRHFWIGDNVEPSEVFDDNEWNEEMNSMVNVILSCSFKFSTLKSLCFLCKSDCTFSLNKENCFLLSQVFRKYKDALEIFVSKGIRYDVNGNQDLLEGIKESNSLKFIFFCGARLSKEIKNKSKELRKKNDNKYLFIQLSKNYIITNHIVK